MVKIMKLIHFLMVFMHFSIQFWTLTRIRIWNLEFRIRQKIPDPCGSPAVSLSSPAVPFPPQLFSLYRLFTLLPAGCFLSFRLFPLLPGCSLSSPAVHSPSGYSLSSKAVHSSPQLFLFSPRLFLFSPQLFLFSPRLFLSPPRLFPSPNRLSPSLPGCSHFSPACLLLNYFLVPLSYPPPPHTWSLFPESMHILIKSNE
jgi:hypothetical protein